MLPACALAELQVPFLQAFCPESLWPAPVRAVVWPSAPSLRQSARQLRPEDAAEPPPALGARPVEVGLLCSSEHLRWVIESASECECSLSQPGVSPESILRYEETAQLASADFLDSLGWTAKVQQSPCLRMTSQTGFRLGGSLTSESDSFPVDSPLMSHQAGLSSAKCFSSSSGREPTESRGIVHNDIQLGHDFEASAQCTAVKLRAGFGEPTVDNVPSIPQL